MVTEKISHTDGKVLEWKWSSNSELMQRPFWTSAYLVDQMLIDCGAPDSAEEIGQFIDSLDAELRPTRCFLTHAHEDHAGTGKFLIERYHMPVFSPPQSIPLLKQGWDYADYRKMTWGETGFQPFESQPYPSSINTSKGYHFDLLPLPGHAPDLHALIEKKQQWAFVGDLMQPQYQMLFGGTCEIQENIKTIFESLEKLYQFTEGMDKMLIFVAGKGVYQGRELIKTRIGEINSLHEKVHQLYKELDTEPKEIRKMRKILQTLFGGESMLSGMSHGELSRENMVHSLLKWT